MRYIFLILATVVLLVGCKPSGPLKSSELISLTNTVRTVTSEPIYSINHLDAANTRVLVLTGSIANKHVYIYERTSSGWNYVPSVHVNAKP